MVTRLIVYQLSRVRFPYVAIMGFDKLSLEILECELGFLEGERPGISSFREIVQDLHYASKLLDKDLYMYEKSCILTKTYFLRGQIKESHSFLDLVEKLLSEDSLFVRDQPLWLGLWLRDLQIKRGYLYGDNVINEI